MSRGPCRPSVLVLLVAAVAATPGRAQTVVTLEPVQDTYLQDIDPDGNHGAEPWLYFGRGVGLGLGNIRTLVQFDLGVLPHDRVRSATFSAWQYELGGGAGGIDCEVYRCLEPWDEGKATWNDQPAYPLFEEWACAEVGDAPLGWIDWDVTDLVAEHATGSLPNDGWLFKVPVESAGISRLGTFRSREYAADPTQRPELEVELYDLSLVADPLVVDETATLAVEGAVPGAPVFVGLSVTGPGTTALPGLGVEADLDGLELLASALADGAGAAAMELVVPEELAGYLTFLQAVSTGRLSDVVVGDVTPRPCDGKFVSPGGGAFGGFGEAAAMAGDWLAIGAAAEDGVVGSTGAAYVHRRDDAGTPADAMDDTWVEHARLVAGDGAPGDAFGASIATDGDRLVVGAPRADGPTGPDEGAAYVYRRDDSGTPADLADDVWLPEGRLADEETFAADRFGSSVGVAGGEAFVGSPLALAGGMTYGGRVTVFGREDGGVWTRRQSLLPADPAPFKEFGWALAADGDRLVVGAPSDGGGPSSAPGAAYVFRRRSTWVQSPVFGAAPAVSEVMRRPTSWVQSAKLEPLPFEDETMLGTSVAVRGDLVALGGPASYTVGGVAYLFRQTGPGPGEDWTVDLRAQAPGGAGTDFGWSVSLDEELLAVGAIDDQDPGAAYVWVRMPDGTWREQQRITDGVGIQDVTSSFGVSVALDAERLAIGFTADDVLGTSSGSVTALHHVPAGTGDPLDDTWEPDGCPDDGD